jgi:hypothetical protein
MAQREGRMTETTIELATPYDSILFTGTDIFGGWIYDNDSLRSWYKLPEIEVKLNKRPNAHGTYSPDQLFAGEARPEIMGKYFGETIEDAHAARLRLLALFSDGRPVLMTVTDPTGATSRQCFVIDVDPEWMPDAHFTFTIALRAPDPRRYADAIISLGGLPTPSSGLTWPLGTAPSGRFWDWGTPGKDGRLAFTNTGTTTTYPRFEVSGGGGLSAGARIVEIETGRALVYARAIPSGGILEINNRTRRAVLNSGDVTANLTRREWFEVPAGQTRTYQFDTLGGVAGTPTLRLIAAPAYL